MQRIEGILRVIAQDSHSPARVQTAEDSVAKLSAQLIELQQSEAALEGQVNSPCEQKLCIAVCSAHRAFVFSTSSKYYEGLASLRLKSIQSREAHVGSELDIAARSQLTVPAYLSWLHCCCSRLVCAQKG